MFYPTAFFVVSNNSRDKTPVDIQIKIGGRNVFNDLIHYSAIRPDLQYATSISLSKGKYNIFITADSGKVNLRQPIMLDSDRWIFITYGYNALNDSLQGDSLIKNFGYDSRYMNTKLPEPPPKVGIYITDKEPVHI